MKRLISGRTWVSVQACYGKDESHITITLQRLTLDAQVNEQQIDITCRDMPGPDAPDDARSDYIREHVRKSLIYMMDCEPVKARPLTRLFSRRDFKRDKWEKVEFEIAREA